MNTQGLPRDLELYSELCRDIAASGKCTSTEADTARRLCFDCEVYGHSERSAEPHPIHRNKTIGQAQEEMLRRRMLSFLPAVLV
jgi:hypothetical protein